MIRFLPLVLILGLTGSLAAQKYRSPDHYFRNFQSEIRKINKKNLLYLKSSLRGDDPRKIARYREMMVEQLKESRQEISKIGSYENYDILQREYMDALDIFIDAYENDFGIAEDLIENRYKSYEDLKKYYDAVTLAEDGMIEASYKMEKADDHFAKTYFFTIERDAETEEEYRLLDEVTLYSRDMNLAFFRVDQHIRDFLKAVNEDKTDTLDIVIDELARDLKVSEKEVAEYADFEGEDDLYQEVYNYLYDIQDEIQEVLRPLAEKLQNRFLDERDYRIAQRDLERFAKVHQGMVESYTDTRNGLIEDYLPED